VFAIILTFVPSLAIVLFIIRSDKFREPVKLIVEAFILGVSDLFSCWLIE